MTITPVVAISIVAALAVVALAALLIRRHKGDGEGTQSEPDYRVFFIIGVCWLPLGIATENPAFTILGLVFIALGLLNHEKWGEEVELTGGKRRVVYVLIGITVLLVVGLLATTLYGRFSQ